jgi:hypothetical protein
MQWTNSGVEVSFKTSMVTVWPSVMRSGGPGTEPL